MLSSSDRGALTGPVFFRFKLASADRRLNLSFLALTSQRRWVVPGGLAECIRAPMHGHPKILANLLLDRLAGDGDSLPPA